MCVLLKCVVVVLPSIVPIPAAALSREQRDTGTRTATVPEEQYTFILE
jgi:hypothetical protein